MNYRWQFALTWLVLLSACSARSLETSAAEAGPVAISIIHLNDTYRVGDVEEGRRGGIGRIATLVQQLKEQGHEVRITHGGDLLYPSLESQLWNGEQMVAALNFLNDLAPVYFVPGNHEFDRRTSEAVVNAVRQSDFTWIADNLEFRTGNTDVDAALAGAFTFPVGAQKIGVFGLALLRRDGGSDKDYAVPGGEYVDVAESAIENLERAGADLIFGLTHLYLADDKKLAALKRRHPTFMFIVGGHDHEPEFHAGNADRAAIMKGASNARTVWQIDIRFDDGEASISSTEITVDQSIEIDADYQLMADKWRKRLLEKMPFLTGRAGEAAVPLDGREVAVRNAESNWANFIVDQMPAAFGEPAADFAFINGGTLRIDDFVAEDITFEDIGRTFGFSSFLRHMTINGRDFVTLLEAGYRGEGTGKGYFPQISGFRVCVDRRREEGRRIVELQIPAAEGWQDIDVDKDYTLVGSDFLYRGGDGYDFSKARDVSRPGSELQYLVLDAILAAQARGEKIGRPVDPADPRIVILDSERSRCFD